MNLIEPQTTTDGNVKSMDVEKKDADEKDSERNKPMENKDEKRTDDDKGDNEEACDHKVVITLPCNHDICNTCFASVYNKNEIVRCQECSFTTEELELYANANNSQACYILGRKYNMTDDKEDEKKARELYIRASHSDDCDPDVYRCLGSMYQGDDDKEALKWYLKFAEVCHDEKNAKKVYEHHKNDIYWELGEMYRAYDTIETNYAEAVKWYCKVEGDYLEQTYDCLADIYNEGGYGIEKDEVKSEEYYIKFAKMTNIPWYHYYQKGNYFYNTGDLKGAIKWYKMAYSMTNDKIISYDKKTSEDDLRSPECVHTFSCKCIGDVYFVGNHEIVQDYMEAYKWYERAKCYSEIKNKNLKNSATVSTFMMGKIQYLTGNYFRATELLEKLDYAPACRLLGSMYANGNNKFSKSLDKAFYWYKLGADKNDSECKLSLGDMYFAGNCHNRDYIKAGNMYESLVLDDKDKQIQKRAIFGMYQTYATIYNTDQAKKYRAVYDKFDTLTNEQIKEMLK